MAEILNLHGPAPRAVFIDLPEGEDSRIAVPLVLGYMHGLQWRRLRPGRDLEQPAVSIPWLVIIDDRFPGACGPGSFDHATLRWLFKDASRVTVDAAEPHQLLYEYLVWEGVDQNLRQLIIHTVNSRRTVWREFTRANCDLYGVLELIPDSKQQVTPSVTRFEGRTPPA
jgi:hypothetical protein